MALLTRRIWSALRDEAILMAGGHAYTSFSSRMEYWMQSAYYDLCAMYHQYELDASKPYTVPINDSSIDLPVDCYIVVGVAEVDENGRTKRFLQPQRPQTLYGIYRREPATLSYYTRFRNALQFDARAIASTRLRLDYYRYPAPPDFAATTGQPAAYPETPWLWDVHILDAAVAKSKRSIWRPDLSQFDGQALSQWLEDQTQAQTKSDTPATEPDRPAVGRPLGGAQG